MLHDVISNPTKKEEKEQAKEIEHFKKEILNAIFNKEARVWLD